MEIRGLHINNYYFEQKSNYKLTYINLVSEMLFQIPYNIALICGEM